MYEFQTLQFIKGKVIFYGEKTIFRLKNILAPQFAAIFTADL